MIVIPRYQTQRALLVSVSKLHLLLDRAAIFRLLSVYTAQLERSTTDTKNTVF